MSYSPNTRTVEVTGEIHCPTWINEVTESPDFTSHFNHPALISEDGILHSVAVPLHHLGWLLELQWIPTGIHAGVAAAGLLTLLHAFTHRVTWTNHVAQWRRNTEHSATTGKQPLSWLFHCFDYKWNTNPGLYSNYLSRQTKDSQKTMYCMQSIIVLHW